MAYGLHALQHLGFAASPLVAFHMHVCEWHTGCGVTQQGCGCLVVFLCLKFEAFVAFRFVVITDVVIYVYRSHHRHWHR